MNKIIIITAALFFSFASLKWFPAPYAWTSFSWFLVFIYFAQQGKSAFIKITAINMSAMLMAIGIFEGFLYINSPDIRRDETRNMDGKIIKRATRHNVLGWIPNKDQTVSWKRYYGDTLLFDVFYKIGNDGLRVTQDIKGQDASLCILFFGGSYTFGAGVNDDETMPYIVGSNHSEIFRVYNFGYSGYGAHQMLAALQNKLVANKIICRPKYAIYLGIADHVRRSSNKARWCRKCGPTYILEDNSKLVHIGQSKVKSSIAGIARAQLQKSYILLVLAERFRFFSWLLDNVTGDDVDLYVAIIDESRNLFEKRYPGSEFHVLLWDDDVWISDEIKSRLQENGTRIHLVSNILTGFHGHNLDYVLSKEDRHPNQRAHKAMAEYISRHVVVN